MIRFAGVIAATLVFTVLTVPPAASDGWRCGSREDNRTQERERVKPRRGHDDVQRWHWDCAISRKDGHVLIVQFGLSDPCHGLERYKVRYFPERVVVTLFQGENSSEGYSCPAVIVPASVRIPLKEDRSGRRVVDGGR